MKYFIVSGEASGDLHASNLVKWIKYYDSFAEIKGWGGDLMMNEGVSILKHIKDLSFFGISEVIANIGTILKNFKKCKNDILEFNPDVVILVDYPGFNLKIVKFAKKNGFKVFYYISPTIWAWKQSRVFTIKKYVDKVFVILPFEKEFYSKFGIDAIFEGHPLLDSISNQESNFLTKENFIKKNNLSDKPIIALLPGSRKSEIKNKLPLMIYIAEQFKQYQFIICGINAVNIEHYNKYLINSNIKILFGQTYNILNNSFAAIVTSGTATLETALFNVPQVVCYKTSFVTYFIAKLFVKVKFISLVNIILNKNSITELIQNKLSKENLVSEFKKITVDEKNRAEILNDYLKLKNIIGLKGASQRIAKIMVNNISD